MDDCVDGSEDGCEELVDGAEKVVNSSSDGHFDVVVCVDRYFLFGKFKAVVVNREMKIPCSILYSCFLFTFCPSAPFLDFLGRKVVTSSCSLLDGVGAMSV